MPQLHLPARVVSSDADSGAACANDTVRLPAFVDIYNAHFAFVWSMARHFGVSSEAIDDVVQDVFVTIIERLHSLEKPEALRSWIYGIVRRVVVGHRRTMRATQLKTSAMRDERDLLNRTSRTPLQDAEQQEQVKLLWSLLNEIDAPKREVFVLAELGEMTVPEIAAAIETPLNTVYSRLRLARRELEDALQRHYARSQGQGRQCPT